MDNSNQNLEKEYQPVASGNSLKSRISKLGVLGWSSLVFLVLAVTWWLLLGSPLFNDNECFNSCRLNFFLLFPQPIFLLAWIGIALAFINTIKHHYRMAGVLFLAGIVTAFSLNLQPIFTTIETPTNHLFFLYSYSRGQKEYENFKEQQYKMFVETFKNPQKIKDVGYAKLLLENGWVVYLYRTTFTVAQDKEFDEYARSELVGKQIMLVLPSHDDFMEVTVYIPGSYSHKEEWGYAQDVNGDWIGDIPVLIYDNQGALVNARYEVYNYPEPLLKNYYNKK